MDELNVRYSSYAVDSYGAGFNIRFPISATSAVLADGSGRSEIKEGVFTVQEIRDF